MLRNAFRSCLLLAVVLIVPTPTEVAAKSAGAGFGTRTIYAGGHRGAHRTVPWTGGFASAPYYSPAYMTDGQSVVIVLPPPEPPYQLTCTRSREIVTVPSENGGLRDIVITGC
jgi:hypothetical protein